jgi:hypothetical protein
MLAAARCGPLVLAVKSTGCMGAGLDLRASAIVRGARERRPSEFKTVSRSSKLI